MKHELKRERAGKAEMGSITPTCSCGWRGRTEYAYNDYCHTNVKEQEGDHIRNAHRGELETANATLEQQMMDACAPKNEREWWAFAEIGRLRAEVEVLKAENERQFTALNDWLYANGPNGWIDLLRHELAAMTTEVEALRAERQVLNSAVVAAKSETAEFAEVAINAQNEVEALRADADRLDCGQIMIDTRDEFGEPKQVWHTGMNLRAAIDAARAAQGGKT